MAVVTNQPASAGFQQNAYGSVLGEPKGLDYLAHVDQLIVKQKIEIVEVMTGCETKNKYAVLNSANQQVYYAFEESELCNRICCGPNRGFIYHIQDNNGQEVMTLERPFVCCVGCPYCADGACKYPIYVYDAQRNCLGILRLRSFCCAPRLGIFDKDENELYLITAKCCRIQCPGCCTEDINHPILSSQDGQQVGNLAKRWGGMMREFMTAADTYVVTFPMDMHVAHKALIFASTFMLDMSIYEMEKQGGGGH